MRNFVTLKSLRRLPVIFKIQAGLVVIALVVSVFAGTLANHGGYQTIAFATPALTKPTMSWNGEVNQFAVQVSNAFGIDVRRAREFSSWILEASERQNIDAELIASLVLTESSFRKNARSHVGAIGPAQVRADYWSGFCGTSDLTDPAENVFCGAQILSYYQDRCGAIDCALQAYNIGLYATDAYRLQAGRRYVAKVGRLRTQLQNVAL